MWSIYIYYYIIYIYIYIIDIYRSSLILVIKVVNQLIYEASPYRIQIINQTMPLNYDPQTAQGRTADRTKWGRKLHRTKCWVFKKATFDDYYGKFGKFDVLVDTPCIILSTSYLFVIQTTKIRHSKGMAPFMNPDLQVCRDVRSLQFILFKTSSEFSPTIGCLNPIKYHQYPMNFYIVTIYVNLDTYLNYIF